MLQVAKKQHQKLKTAPEWEKRKLYVEGGRSGFKGKQ